MAITTVADSSRRGVIGAYLRRARDDRAWSQEELAKHAGVSQALMSLVENGKRDLPRRAITRLVQLGFDAGRLAGESSTLEARRESAEGWIAYDRATQAHNGLRLTIGHLAQALRPHHTYLATRITDVDGRRALDEIVQATFLQAQRWRLPSKDEMRAAIRAGRSQLPSPDGVAAAIELLESLSPSDLSLTVSLMKRLTDDRLSVTPAVRDGESP